MSVTGTSWLDHLGLGRPELRAWAFYDWANSAFLTTIVAAVFPVYYNNVAAKGLAPETAAFNFSMATTIALAVSAVIAPVLGAIADHRPYKKLFLVGFMLIGVIATMAMAAIGEGDWALAIGLFMVANVAVSGSIAFYDSLLPHIAAPDELDKVSSSGFAHRLPGRRPVAARQPRVDPAAARASAFPTWASPRAWRSSASGSGGSCSRSR